MDLSVRVAGSAIAGGAVELWGRMKELTKMCTGQFALDRLCSLPKSRSTKGLASQAAKKLCFVSGHDFTCCKKTPASYNATTLEHADQALYQATTLHVAKKLLLHIAPRLWRIAEKLIGFVIRTRLYRLQKSSCFV
jgi:hypothetical protein